MKEENSIKIHFCYVVFILLATLIAVATDRWTTQRDFTTYLSNAATMTSLVLGLIAIFYSFISNDGLSKSLGNISTVADAVKESKSEISKYLELTKSSTENARGSADAISSMALEVRTTLGTLQESLDAVRGETQLLNASITSLPARFDALEGKFKLIEGLNISSKLTAVGSDAPVGVEVGNSAKKMLDNASMVIKLMIYGLVLAKASGKPFFTKEFAKIVGFGEMSDVLFGYIMAFSPLGLVKMDYKDDGLDVKMVHEYFEKNANTIVMAALNDKRLSDEKDKWKAAVSGVEDMFKV